MCGIAGVFQKRTPVEPSHLKAMNDAIRHRGPDDEGFLVRGNFGMAMRRLSIIDVTGGHQPITNETGDVSIVFNGEIYNFAPLHAELSARGHRFKTKSDTETIVHAYEEYGKDCVQKLEGMFAFCVFDERKQELFIARDRMGEKPLYYALTEAGDFYFGSEAKALLAHPAFGAKVDHQALADFFTFNYIPAPHSAFADVKKLSPGRTLTFSLGRGELSIAQYWHAESAQRSAQPLPTVPEASRRVVDLLGASVKKMLVSEVPIGIFLSGGIDSSAITALAARSSSARINTFSVVHEDPSFDERTFARRVAAHCGTNHTEIPITHTDALSLIPEIGLVLDEPFGDVSIIPTYLLCRGARAHMTVALGGDGGDELFGGYPTHAAHRLNAWYQTLPAMVRRLIEQGIAPRLPTSFNDFSFDFKVKRFLGSVYEPALVRHARWQSPLMAHDRMNLFTSDFLASVHGYDPLIQQKKSAPAYDYRAIEREDIERYLPDDILFKVDRSSMANSLEVRAPFLDPALVQYALSLPPEYKIRRMTTKYILKKSMEGILPNDIIYRKKKGFGIPLGKWLRQELYGFMQEILSPAELAAAGIFNPEAVRQLMEVHRLGTKDNRKQLWAIMMVSLWHRKWIRKQS